MLHQRDKQSCAVMFILLLCWQTESLYIILKQDKISSSRYKIVMALQFVQVKILIYGSKAVLLLKGLKYKMSVVHSGSIKEQGI
jgi:hypothetical protein